MLTLGIKKIDKFVREQNELGNDVRWETYLKTLVFFRPADAAVYSKDGAFRNGRWGFDNRVEVNEKGVFDIDFRNIKKSIRRTGPRQ